MTDADIQHSIADHGAALRRLARSLLRDAHRVDDVVQATMLRAMTARQRPVGSLRAWLAAILRNEARRSHRDDVRRARREAIAARPEATPGADREVHRLAVLRALLDALEELPAEQREAVTLRHLDGLPLRVVAARQGVPVRSAETRIRRGLERLRARLDGRFGERGAWVSALAPWVAGAGSTGFVAGLLIMNGKIAVAAVVLCALWLCWPRAERPAGPAGHSGAGLAAVEVSGPESRLPPQPTEAPVLRTEVAPATALQVATVRGRFVDELGAPIAGVEVRVSGRSDRRSADVERWLLERGMFGWVDPEPVSSSPDGRFAVQFEPPPPYEFHWSTGVAGFARLSADLGSVAPGEERDLGDIVLVPGARLSGVIIDEDGAPQQGARFTVMAKSIDRAVEEPFSAGFGYNPVTVEDGTFTTPGWWSPGQYLIDVAGFRVLEPTELVHVTAPATDLRIVVARVDPANVITGTVVDDGGEPLSGVRFADDNLGGGSGGWTYPGGRFRVARPDGDAAATARLLFERQGFDPLRTELAWGTRDARVVMPRGDLLVLRVAREDGAAVERFGLRFLPAPEIRRRSADQLRLEHFGVHPRGVLEVPGVDASQGHVRVVPEPASGLWASAFLDLRAEASGHRELVVVLPEPRVRLLRVIDPVGAAVVGARFELLEEVPGMAVDRGTQVIDRLFRSSRSSRTWAVEVQVASSDARGEIELVGPADRALALRYSGPGGTPFVIRDLRLDDPAPLVVQLEAGARVVGHVGPAELLADLRERAGLPRTGPIDQAGRDRMPAVVLSRPGEGGREECPAEGIGGPIVLGDDGRFDIAGVPPGDWKFELRATSDRGSRGGYAVVDLVGLRPGETRALDLQRPAWRPAVVRARIVVDGGATIAPTVFFHELTPASETAEGVTATVDAAGGLTAWLPAGTWSATVSVRVSASESVQVVAQPTLVVAPAARVEVELRAATGTLPIRVLAADGTPVEGVRFRSADRRSPIAGKPTDAAGRTLLHGGVGTFSLLTRVRSLASEVAWRRFYLEHSDDEQATADAWVAAGTVDIRAGPGVEVELRLPAEWGQR